METPIIPFMDSSPPHSTSSSVIYSTSSSVESVTKKKSFFSTPSPKSKRASTGDVSLFDLGVDFDSPKDDTVEEVRREIKKPGKEEEDEDDELLSPSYKERKTKRIISVIDDIDTD